MHEYNGYTGNTPQRTKLLLPELKSFARMLEQPAAQNSCLLRLEDMHAPEFPSILCDRVGQSATHPMYLPPQRYARQWESLPPLNHAGNPSHPNVHGGNMEFRARDSDKEWVRASRTPAADGA